MQLTDNNATVEYNIGEDVIKLSPSIVKNFITGEAQLNNQEYKLFVEICKVRRLNPFLKEVHCVKYGNQPAQIIVDKIVFEKRANNHKAYSGKESGIIVLYDDKIEYRQGNFKLPSETLVGGWARVYRKDREHPEYTAVTLSEVIKLKKDGSVASTWATQPCFMVEKVAIVRALRGAFPEDLSGMYTEDEMLATDTKDNTIIQAEPEITEQGDPEPINEYIIDGDFEEMQAEAVDINAI